MKKHLLLAFLCVLLVIVVSSCPTPDGGTTPTVSLAAQSGTIISGTAGTATFAATTANIADGTSGSVTWYTNSAGTTPTSAPAGIAATVTPVSNNSSTISIAASNSGLAGSFYFTVTFGSAKSAITAFVITSSQTYTVTYSPSGATSGNGPIDSNTYLQGTTVTVVTPNTLEKNGYAFADWNTMPDGSGTNYTAGATFTMGSSNVTLYIVWMPSNISFTSSGSSITITGHTTAPTGSLTIPEGVTSIADSAFNGCTGLTSVTIPSSVTVIGSGAFLGCTGLTTVIIPSSVTSIGYAAFARVYGPDQRHYPLKCHQHRR